MKKRTVLIIILIILTIGGIVSFFLLKNKPKIVKRINLDHKIVDRTVNASGIVKSKNEADLAFSGIGKITSINVEKNENVLKHTLIATLDNYSDNETAKSLKDSRDIALRDRDLFVQMYENDKNKIGGKEEYAIQLRRYDEAVSKANSTYNAQIGSVNKAYLYTPFEGTIVDKYKEVGETAMSGEKIVKLADLSNLIFQIDLDQEDFGFVKVGQNVDIKLDSYPDETFMGVIEELPSYADIANNNNFTVDIKIIGDNKEKVLLGMTGDGYIVLSTTEKEVPVLTYDEVFYDLDNKPYLFLLDKDKVKKTYIEIGLQGDIYTEIKTSIDKTIVTSDSEKVKLDDGEKVSLKN